ncbi:unnamed protein product [marine sediment metagenome]|uniref:Uncharacterized protein n=1 Tax=marine sediment metagenome TaxID=412755 RepID=X1EDI5_9ZZZZ
MPLSKRQQFIHRIEMIINLQSRIYDYFELLVIYTEGTSVYKEVKSK